MTSKRITFLALIVAIVAILAALKDGESARMIERAATETGHRNEALVRQRAARPAVSAHHVAERRVPATIDVTPFMQNDPQYRVVHLQNMRDTVRYRYGDLNRLGLPSDRKARLQQLLINYFAAPIDAGYAARQQGIDPNSQEMKVAQDAAQRLAWDDIAGYLGPVGVRQLEAAQTEVGMKDALFQSGWYAALASSGVGLSQQQFDQVVTFALAQRPADRSLDAPAVSARIRELLTPDQIVVYTDYATLPQEKAALQQRAVAAAAKQYGPGRNYSWSYP